MNVIVEMRYGSHLYGTATQQSDIDLKSVYVPSARDILLQRVRPVIALSAPRAPGQKSAPGEVERETYSLQRFLGLLAEGQTMALDMLFAPDSAMTMPPAPLWREIQAHAHRLVSRRASAFLGYCRRQANTYGIKGTRVAAARNALAVLSAAEARLGAAAKLSGIAHELEALTTMEHVTFFDREVPGGAIIRHLDVCDHKAPFTASIKTAREMLQRLVDEYGQRALQAERQEGVDWKALSHAVRIGREAIELFETGRIVFPLRYAGHLLRIKLGELPYGAVADEIERLLEEVEAAAAASTLREEPDRRFIDDLVARVHAESVADGGGVPPG